MSGLDTNFYEQLSTGPGHTIVLVVQTATTLVNLDPDFVTPSMCLHIVNVVKPQQETQSLKMMIDINLKN